MALIINKILIISKRLVILLLISTLVCYGFWFFSRIFLFDQFITPTESMIPTLLTGDRIIVDKRVFGARIYSDFNFDKNGNN